jgi:hypothetical protein
VCSLVHRRDGLRAPREVHLSPDGIELAHGVGRTSARFDRVATSPSPRAVETPEAMGFKIDAQLEELGTLPDPIARLIERRVPSTIVCGGSGRSRRLESSPSASRGNGVGNSHGYPRAVACS